ncbi:MAG: hypothetical protein ACFBQW_05640 [Sphingomonadaceae bacterium]
MRAFPRYRRLFASAAEEAAFAHFLRLSLAGDEDAAADELRGEAARIAGHLDRIGLAAPLRCHAAIIASAAARLKIAYAPPLRHRIEALALREKTRSALVAEQSEVLERLLFDDLPPPLPLRGWRFAQRCYDEPESRHCHALHWLVPEAAVAEVLASRLAQAGRKEMPGLPLAPHKRIYAAPGQADVELHLRPFAWADASACETIAGPEFAAAEILGSAMVEPGARSCRWMIDLSRLLRREALDVGRFARIVDGSGFSDAAAAGLREMATYLPRRETQLRARLGTLANAAERMPGGDRAAVEDLAAVHKLVSEKRKIPWLGGLRDAEVRGRAKALLAQRAAKRRSMGQAREALRQRFETGS